MQTYIAIVFPADGERGTPGVREIRARFPADAAEKAEVAPGQHVLIVERDRTHRFDRAAIAPLEERSPDGNHLPTAGPA